MQFWLSAQVEDVENHGVCITGCASHRDADQIALLSINNAKLRDALNLPSRRDLNLLRYSANPTDDEICQFVKFLGYNKDLFSRTLFRRGRMPPLWNTLFSILNRALTCKTLNEKGDAQFSKGMLSYLNEKERTVYIRGHRTPELEPTTPHA